MSNRALAMTIHRSQGSQPSQRCSSISTTSTAPFAVKRWDHNRAAYTAVTRASRFLGILDPTYKEA